MRSHSLKVALVGGVTAVVLAGGSTAAMAVISGALGPGNTAGQGATPVTARSFDGPALPGSVVEVTLTDMGRAMHGWGRGSFGYGGMMGGVGPTWMNGPGSGHLTNGQWRGRMMQVRLSRDLVPAGTVSLRVSDVGVMDHELVVLPLADGARAGQRSVGSDGTVDEHGSLGEVSNNGGAGAGEGLHPGGTGWTTLHLQPGRYELVCNLPGHYAAGMFAELDVTDSM
jgi:uncharacterized cupredoxin-like copper-binding protein